MMEIYSSSGDQEVPADSVSGESSLPGSQTAVFLVEGMREFCEISFIRAASRTLRKLISVA